MVALPEDLEVPTIFRNLDLSLRVILNETRVLRETMEDVERQVAGLQGEMADVRRSLHEAPSTSTSAAGSPSLTTRRDPLPMSAWAAGEEPPSDCDRRSSFSGSPARDRGVASADYHCHAEHLPGSQRPVSVRSVRSDTSAPSDTRFPLGPVTSWGISFD